MEGVFLSLEKNLVEMTRIIRLNLKSNLESEKIKKRLIELCQLKKIIFEKVSQNKNFSLEGVLVEALTLLILLFQKNKNLNKMIYLYGALFVSEFE